MHRCECNVNWVHICERVRARLLVAIDRAVVTSRFANNAVDVRVITFCVDWNYVRG